MSCPKCDWDWADDGFYYINRKGKATDCTKYIDADGRLEPNPPKAMKAYPVYSNKHSYFTLEAMGAQYSWDELHYCPECKEEFTINNSSC